MVIVASESPKEARTRSNEVYNKMASVVVAATAQTFVCCVWRVWRVWRVVCGVALKTKTHHDVNQVIGEGCIVREETGTRNKLFIKVRGRK